MIEVPSAHLGVHYTSFMSELSKKRSPETYLEIGVGQGTLLSEIYCASAIAVDPCPALCANVSHKKRRLFMYQMTSDEFFSEDGSELRDPIDLAFLDGMHLFEFLLRDFINTEHRASKQGLIALHDCLPLTAEMAHRDDQEALRLSGDTRYPGWWTGDVWKVVAILRRYRPDLQMLCIDCPPTGIVICSQLDPESSVLSDNYAAIISDFMGLESSLKNLLEFYSSTSISSSESVLYGLGLGA